MEGINLEEYKSAWKTEQSFFEEKLSMAQIVNFMQQTSKNISGLFKKSIIIDIIIKIILSLSFGVLLVLYSNQNTVILTNTVLIILTVLCMVIQIKIYKKIPDLKYSDQDIKALLYSFIDFYLRRFKLSLLISSFSSVLFFISGAFYYFYFKYGTIRSFQNDDYLIFVTIIIIGFLFSAFVQIKNFSFRIRQLENSLTDIEQEVNYESGLKHFKKLNRRNIIIYSIAVIVGLLLFFLILLQK